MSIGVTVTSLMTIFYSHIDHFCGFGIVFMLAIVLAAFVGLFVDAI